MNDYDLLLVDIVIRRTPVERWSWGFYRVHNLQPGYIPPAQIVIHRSRDFLERPWSKTCIIRNRVCTDAP